MVQMQKKWMMVLAVGFFLLCSGCSQTTAVAAKTSEPEASLSCVGVLPVAAKSENANAVHLQDGVQALGDILHRQLASRQDVRFVTASQLEGFMSTAPEGSLARMRKIGDSLSCNGVLQVKLLRYKDRVGGQYTANEPASVAFTYRLLDVNSGVTLCQGRYDEVQQSVMENLYNFSRASKRGFTWVTAEELLREGVGEKLKSCSYLQPVE